MYVRTQAKKRFDCFFQIKYVANDTYHYGFKDLVEVVERYGGEYVKNKFLVKAKLGPWVAMAYMQTMLITGILQKMWF